MEPMTLLILAMIALGLVQVAYEHSLARFRKELRQMGGAVARLALDAGWKVKGHDDGHAELTPKDEA